MNRFIVIKIILLVIIIIAAILRLWNLGGNPPHLTPDEAALGYNAYSILKTGKDEYGQILPVIFKSFGDYKPGLYVYLTVPFVAIFGLTEFAVRLPSALFGILSVFLIFRICLKTDNWKLAIPAAFFAAVNPWLIYFSRGAWEANVALTLTLAGIYFFFKSFKYSKLLLLSSGFLALTYLTYQGAKLSTTIVVAVLVIVYFKSVLKIDRQVLVSSGVLGLLICAPIILSLLHGQAGRLEVFSVFSYPRPVDYMQNFLDEGGEKIGGINYYLFHSETFNFLRGVMGRWFNYFSARFLFFEGDYANPGHTPPNAGMLLLLDSVLLILGLMYLVKFKSRFKWFVLAWLILAPLPGAVSRDQVNSIRSLSMAVSLIIIVALGVIQFFEFVRRFKFKRLVYVVFCILYFGNIIYFLDSYFVHQPTHNAKYWFYGYEQVVQQIWPARENYTKIVFQQSYSQPYMYFLFYAKYDPSTFQKQANLVLTGPDVGLVKSLEKIEFADINIPDLRNQNKYLVVANYVTLPEEIFTRIPEFKLVNDVTYPDGQVAFRIVETR